MDKKVAWVHSSFLSKPAKKRRKSYNDYMKSHKEKLKQLKEVRSRKLTDAHHYMFSMVASHFDIDAADIVEAVVDSQQHINLCESFIQKDGISTMLFYFQQSFGDKESEETNVPEVDSKEIGVYTSDNESVKTFITSGFEIPLVGDCFYFIKEKKEMEVTPANVTSLIRGTFSTAEFGILGESYRILMNVFNPILKAANTDSTWGILAQSASGKKTIQSFIDYYDNFAVSLQAANESVKGVVTLPRFDSELQLKSISRAQQCVQLATNEALCKSLEKTVLKWCNIIKQTLMSSSELRVDKDHEGPMVELEYWRHLNIKYNSILEEIRGHECRMAIQILNITKSRVLKSWRVTNDKLTDVANEARDNVTYLYSLEKYCKALYHGDPPSMAKSLHSLMNAIRTIFTISRYYNNSEKATGLLLKITNQMLIACKVYLTDHGREKLWDQPRKEIISKIADCVKLRNAYKEAYRYTKNKMAQVPGGIHFDFSEMCIFGKFESFCLRLDKILFILNSMEIYDVLKTCLIDGIDPISTKFQTLFNNIKSKKYDILDLRMPNFNTDFDEFNKTLNELEISLYTFMNSGLSKIKATLPALKYLERFQQLNIPKLDCTVKFQVLFKQYGKEIEDIRQYYLANYLDPPIHNNAPPVVGKISWAKVLSKKLENPMHHFMNYSSVMKDRFTKRIVFMYNILQQVLVEFELVYHKAWTQFIYSLQNTLMSPPLTILEESNKIIVNLNSIVLQVFEETTSMIKLDLDVPHKAKLLLFSEHEVKHQKYLLQVILNKSRGVRKKAPEQFSDLFITSCNRITYLLGYGIHCLSWMSPNLSLYCSRLLDELNELELFIDTTMSLKERRIDNVLDSLATTVLFDIDVIQAWTLVQYVEEVERQTKQRAAKLSLISLNIQQTISDMTTMIVDRALQKIYRCLEVEEDKKTFTDEMNIKELPPAMMQLTPEAVESELNIFADKLKELYLAFNMKFTDCLFKAAKLTADSIRKRLINFGKSQDSKDTYGPLITSVLILENNNIILDPSVEMLQESLTDSNDKMLQIFKSILLWNQEKIMPWMSRRLKAKVRPGLSFKEQRCKSSIKGALPEDNVGLRGSNMESIEEITSEPETFYNIVNDNKEIQSLMSVLNNSLAPLNAQITLKLNKFTAFSFLWDSSKDLYLEEFMKTDPQISEFNAELVKFDKLEEETQELEDSVIVGPFLLDATLLKKTISGYIMQWKTGICQKLNEKYRILLNNMLLFIDEQTQSLGRSLRDLEDIRLLMISLDSIQERQIEMDMNIIPIEEAYSLLGKYQYSIPQDELNWVDTLRYKFRNLLQQHKEISENLNVVAPKFKDELITSSATLTTQIKEFESAYSTTGPTVAGLTPGEASERLNFFTAVLEQLWRSYQTCSGGEQLFGLPITEHSALFYFSKETQLLQRLYTLYNLVINTIDGYYDILWADLNISKITNDLTDFQAKFKRLPKKLEKWQAYHDLKKKIDDFNESCPLLELMASKTMEARHWQKISDITKTNLDVKSSTFRLRDLMKAPLLQYRDEIEDACISSVKEKDIESKLKVVVDDWTSQNFVFAPFKARGELLLKTSDIVEVTSKLEDSLMVLNYLLTNRYNAPYRKSIQEWIGKLTVTLDIIEKWLFVQNLWIYLEAVFVGGDIAKQLPAEAKRFHDIDKTWVRIMQKAHDEMNIVNTCVGDDLLGHMLPHLSEQLELCQKSLTGYLECKRAVFPRFYFVSDPALLEILGQASDCHTIQPHLLSVSENINEVEFDTKLYEHILSCISREGEKIVLEGNMRAIGNVEVWLGDLLTMQQKSLHSIINMAFNQINEEDFNLLGFMYEAIAQVGLLALQFYWTQDSEEALKASKTNKHIMVDTAKKFLNILNMFIEQTSKPLTKYEAVKFETIITIHLHQKDIFDDLVRLHIKSPSDFEWLKQSRFYFDEEESKTLCLITDVTCIYQNEFIGCSDRLVITPLTDRCYITMAQSLGMSMGAAPAGPAGTGKTETVKDMGKALGKYVVVFNCSDQMDFRGLGRIFKGLAQSGSWGCFDEFNRIELPVLSVAAQQIWIVLMAKKNKKKSFLFSDGEIVSMNPEFGIFLTMNPGYAGRQELPENLKVMFRTVAMMVPDRMIIIRIKLASNGFLENVILSQKFYVLYKLCEEQLSKQVHYDFGLRNILSVLRTLGATKKTSGNEAESMIVMKVLKDLNLSKLVDEDEPLLLSLINDLFPMTFSQPVMYPALQSAIEKNVDLHKLVNYPQWNLKVIQLYETQRVRHGMMTLGPSGAGKTCCINTLMRSMTDIGLPHKEMRMNPKAITAPQMFGRLDVASNDWTDGIFSALWRKTLKVKKSESVWLVLDGPVDAIWIENLNSVLDDTKKLTLANGDRIPMAVNCKIIFEVHNIDNASPATVSRNGMVFMSSSCLDWKPILQAWLLTRNASESEILTSLFNKIYQDIVDFGYGSLVKKMEVLQCMEIKQAIDILEGLMGSQTDRSMHMSAAHVQKLFIFSLMWSFGNLLELDGRVKLQDFMIRHPSKLIYPKLSGDWTIFEFLVDSSGEWIHWSERVPEYIYPTDSIPEYAGILIPNVDNVRTNFLIQTIAKQRKAVLLIGEQGTAKTVMVKGFMSQYNKEEHLSKSIVFSSATTPNIFQTTVESCVEKRIGATYGPPGGKSMTLFIDDVNMPLVNEWGDQPTNEIVRQLMECHGFYNLAKPGEFSSVIDLQLIGAMIHPGGGRNDIPQRLKRQFSIFNCTLPSNNSMDKIFRSIALGYFCPERDFNSEVIELIEEIIPMTRTLWQNTKVKMLPTPAKFHYVFNLRDLSRIWEGILMIKSGQCQSEEQILALWKHECTRVIADRFVSHEDRRWFEGAVLECLSQAGMNEPSLLYFIQEPYFVDILRDAPELTGDEPEDSEIDFVKLYEKVPSMDALHKRLTMYMQQYSENTRGSTLNMVLFKDAMTHLVKVLRIIRTPGGNALLVGVGGSGKKSTARLASYIYDNTPFQITLSRSYGINNLLEDLKFLMRSTGALGKGITFVFTDNEIKDESFLDYINNLLSTGEISGLFPRDEMDEILQSLVPIMKKEMPKHPPTNENLSDYFFSRVRKNLHIILCFSPVGPKFRSRSLKFPGLISGCTVDWFSGWPDDALYAVSNHFLSDMPMVVQRKETKAHLIKSMGEVHTAVAQNCSLYFQRFRRQTHVTPKSFLGFVAKYKSLYKERLAKIQEMANQMSIGLSKLDDATLSVDILTKELVVKEKDLNFANIKADKVLAEVTESTREAEEVKTGVLLVKNKAEKIVLEIGNEKEIAEAKLEEARPALEEAEAALGTIKAQHISTVRKLAKPPHLIMRIMDSVLILLQKKLDHITPDPERACPKPSWLESLKLMGNLGFLNSLLQFPKDTINEEVVELLQPYLTMEDFTLESAKKVCGDVAGLASWIKAMCSFFAVNKEVLPLKANLAVQEARLTVATKELNDAQAQLDEKEAVLAKVQALYDTAQAEKQMLLDDAQMCKRKMEIASVLISRLGGEHVRWTNQSKEFAAEIERLVGDAFLLTGFLCYVGPFNQEFRSKMLNSWFKLIAAHHIPHSPNLVITSSLVDSTNVVEWNLQGLPSDELSTQNGIIVTQGTRYPLLIDPQGQGRGWIKSKEKQRDLIVTNFSHKYFRQQLEDCLSLGKPMLVEEVQQELDLSIENVLDKNYVKMGTGYKVMVGDKECDIGDGFYIYFTTKLPNPAFSPEVFALVNVIDFTVTMKGLEDQLLNRVVVAEQSQLEAERLKLIEDVNSNKKKMKELEANLLEKLSTTEGSLLDDESVLTVLNTTKATAADVSEQLAIADETELKINKAREEYRQVATRGSILYFLLCEMSHVNCMYQTSLKLFLHLFDLSLENSEKTHIVGKRLTNIIEYLTYEVFKYTSRGLYEEHKFLLSLFLALKKDLQANTIQQIEFNTLIKGGASLDLNSVPHKPYKWLTDIIWLNIIQVSKLHGFSEVPNQVQRSEKQWKEWFDKSAPEEEMFPDNYHNILNTFQKLLFIRSLCPDRTIAQARKYIAESMGPKYIESVILELKSMWEESNPAYPLICLLSMGSDPTSQIEDLAKKMGIECRAISMGQGQEVHARNLLSLFTVNGGWALLQNCHLALAFMDELFDMLITTENMHENFRLWLTTEVHPSFHVGLLQMSIKYTNDPPQGIKAGLKRTYMNNVNQDLLEATALPQWRPMLYAVSFLHTVVQERRKFGPLGWNIPYEFNLSDWSASVQFVQNHLDDMDIKKGVSWVTVRYMLGEIQYGGRVTDDYDKRLLNTFAKVWFSENMFQESFQFYKGYQIPVKLKKLEDIRAYINNNLPPVDPPEAFGLHSNAGITYQTEISKAVLDTILSIQPKDSSTGGETREAAVFRMADEMLKKLPAIYKPHDVKTRIAIMGSLQPLNIFFKQEIDRMVKVLIAVNSILQDLKLAIEGTIIMNEDLKDALDNIYDAKVPAIWDRISWFSSSVGFWFTELLDRNEQFYSWLFVERPISFWMTGFFNPQGFLTAVRQEITRSHKGWCLDSVMLQNEVTNKWMKEELNAPPVEGVYVHGIFLEGASWDKRTAKLVESPPKILFSNLPIIRMFASQVGPRDPRMYACPIYKKPRRTDLNFITQIYLKTTVNPDHWVLRGTAALADTK